MNITCSSMTSQLNNELCKGKLKCFTKNRQGGDEHLTLNMLDVPIEITPWDGPINEIQVRIKSEVRPCPGVVG